MDLQARISQAFTHQFNTHPPLIARAPGRVNLIGEHTDYNDGFVLPMAIDRAIWMALQPRPDNKVILHSLDFNQSAAFDLDDFSNENAGWAEYVKGVAWALQEDGFHLSGWEGVVAGDVPLGAGLSSSAALEVASARAFAAVSNLAWDPPSMARLSQKAEIEWVGLNCGIMDQMISAAAKAGHALLIDCRSLDTEFVPLPPDTAVVVLDTNTRRGLIDSAYNERVAQTRAAADYFEVSALRDVSLSLLEAQGQGLDELIYRRARHVIGENNRTLTAIERMRAGDANALGKLMNASHESLRDDYEVSSKELNVMVDIAQNQPGSYGARMTGGGFGGCAVALVEAEAAATFAREVAQAYQARTNIKSKVYICEPSNGAEIFKL